MLEFDLAELYEAETRVLNQAAKRNIERIPADSLFQLDKSELEFLRSQIMIIETGSGQHRKYLPLAFTEQGLAILSGVTEFCYS